MTPSVLEFAGMSKDYRGLRPLRIAELRVAAADHVAILGFDRWIELRERYWIEWRGYIEFRG